MSVRLQLRLAEHRQRRGLPEALVEPWNNWSIAISVSSVVFIGGFWYLPRLDAGTAVFLTGLLLFLVAACVLLVALASGRERVLRSLAAPLYAIGLFAGLMAIVGGLAFLRTTKPTRRRRNR